jgi:hypothetical protein
MLQRSKRTPRAPSVVPRWLRLCAPLWATLLLLGCSIGGDLEALSRGLGHSPDGGVRADAAGVGGSAGGARADAATGGGAKGGAGGAGGAIA